jgi:hypothetical protein
MSYLKDREIWLSSVPTGNPPAGYVWVFIQNGVFVVRDSNGVDKIMATTTGTVTNATSASYVEYSNVANKPALISGSSQVSFNGITDKPALVSSSAQIVGYNLFATTGSNQFNGSQAVTGSLTVTGQVVAQTLNVQQVTSSIVYSSGSNIFGNSLGNTQQFTGSLQVSGSSHYLLGNVLIGTTTNSNSRFQVIGPNSNLLPLVDLVASGTGLFQRGVRLLNSGMNSGDHIMYAVGQADNARNMGQVYFQYSGSASTSNRLSFGLHSVDDVLNILGTGNVGVGTVSPSAKLEVEAASNPEISIASTAGATSNLLSFRATSHTQPIQTQLKTIDNGNFTSDLAFLFKASGTGGTLSEKMRITSDGKLQVLGTTGLPATSGTTQNGTLRLQLVGYGTVLDFGAEGPSTGKQWIQATNSTDLSIKYPLLLNPNGGNVGIGTDNPGQRLSVFQDTNGDARLSLINPNTGASARTFLYIATTGNRYVGMLAYGANATGTTVGLSNASLGIIEAGADVSNFLINSTNPIVFGVNGSERMRITSGGLVRIGPVTDSDGTLQVRGLSQNTYNSDGYNGTGANIRLLPSSTGGTNITTGISMGVGGAAEAYIGAVQQSNTLADIVFQIFNGSAYAERMRITSGGTLYIGTATNPLSNATPLLGIVAGAATDAVNIKHTQNGNNTVNIWQTGESSFAALAFYKGDSQGATVGSINCTTSATTFTTTSDYRLKENIVPVESGLNRLMQLKPSKFNWITTGEEAEGFIAHELQEIFPYAVAGEKDAIYSSTGNIKPQSVDYGRITPLLVKAIQELKSENDNLKSRLEVLEQS